MCKVVIIASIGENNEIGRGGDLCWHIPADLKHFKALTMGHTLIMGRKTWESLPRKPLLGRLNIIVSASGRISPEYLNSEEVIVAKSLSVALDIARKKTSKREKGDIFIIGGASIYERSMPFAHRLELTRIFASDPEADTYFPEISGQTWIETKVSDVETGKDGVRYSFVTYENSGNKP